ncbi:hypothetical protein FOMG_17701 [Fusarium oxysporum f. sp. melonis 26406]|uniref:Uncharacterized protein n=1 Tax=Fusarium oxysporum f. sp. melonis 26406 TaxID=1089452 RepID=W9Z1J2_FUSOX|nr:hypothetical protein FOMG_17701 [Fusarium oxysporum f. sp. melonis 26406]
MEHPDATEFKSENVVSITADLHVSVSFFACLDKSEPPVTNPGDIRDAGIRSENLVHVTANQGSADYSAAGLDNTQVSSEARNTDDTKGNQRSIETAAADPGFPNAEAHGETLRGADAI